MNSEDACRVDVAAGVSKDLNNKPPTVWEWLGTLLHTHRCKMPGGHRPKLATHLRQKITQSPFQNSKTADSKWQRVERDDRTFGQLRTELNWYIRLRWDSEVTLYIGIDNLLTQRTNKTKKLHRFTVRDCKHSLDVINWVSKRAKIRKHVGGERSVLFQLWLSVYFWK